MKSMYWYLPGWFLDKDDAGGGEGSDDPAPDKSKGGETKSGGEDHMVPKSRLDEVLQEKNRLAAEQQALKEKLEAREKEELKEKEQYKELAEKLEKERDEERLARMRFEVGSEKGLPADLTKRLTGETREELEADADSLMEALENARSGGKGTPPGNSDKSSKEPLDLNNMSPAEIRDARKEGKI